MPPTEIRYKPTFNIRKILMIFCAVLIGIWLGLWYGFILSEKALISLLYGDAFVEYKNWFIVMSMCLFGFINKSYCIEKLDALYVDFGDFETYSAVWTILIDGSTIYGVLLIVILVLIILVSIYLIKTRDN